MIASVSGKPSGPPGRRIQGCRPRRPTCATRPSRSADNRLPASGARGPAPRHRPGLEQLGEQPQLVLEQLLVAGQVVAEQRIRLGERAAAEDHLGAAVRQRVERREALKHAHRIVGAEHGDRRAQEDARGAAGDRGEHDLGRRDREVGAMVLADAERIEADPVGEHRLVDDVAQHVRGRMKAAIRRGLISPKVSSPIVTLSVMRPSSLFRLGPGSLARVARGREVDRQSTTRTCSSLATTSGVSQLLCEAFRHRRPSAARRPRAPVARDPHGHARHRHRGDRRPSLRTPGPARASERSVLVSGARLA